MHFARSTQLSDNVQQTTTVHKLTRKKPFH